MSLPWIARILALEPHRRGDRTPHDGVVLSAMLGEEEAVRVGGLLPLATREPGQDDEAEPDRR
ncbi:hypothetical protein PV350_16745 [Streptomyces sp. PA03-6a]|nr:hypothetical protein [Streptomyces sp. PA03-6a]